MCAILAHSWGRVKGSRQIYSDVTGWEGCHWLQDQGDGAHSSASGKKGLFNTSVWTFTQTHFCVQHLWPRFCPICHSVLFHFIPSPSTVWRKQYCVFKIWLFCYYQIQLDYGQKVRPLKVFSLRILKFCIDLFKCHVFCVSQKPSLGKAITNLFVMDWSLQIVLKGYDHFNMCSLYY